MSILRSAALCAATLFLACGCERPGFRWESANPEDRGFDAAGLETLWSGLEDRGTRALIVVRRDQLILEKYRDFDRDALHSAASVAKSTVSGLSLLLAMDDGLLSPDDPAHRFIPQWKASPEKSSITIRHLATHTSGIEDAWSEEEAARGVQLNFFEGWKGEFWKNRDNEQAFRIARDVAPVSFEPGTDQAYSSTGIAALGYALTAAFRSTPHHDLRSLLRERIMKPIGIGSSEWSCGYDTTCRLDGLPLIPGYGGAAYTPRALARIGRLMLRKGDWDGRRLLSTRVVEAALRHSGTPGHSGLGWWLNRTASGERVVPSLPRDAFWAWGAGEQVLLVVPSLDLVVVRNGAPLDAALSPEEAIDRYIGVPLMDARSAPYRPSPVIAKIEWEDAEEIVRLAPGSDNWPLAWAADGDLYGAYGDGLGFAPHVSTKLSLGFARITGPPGDPRGVNLRSPTGEQTGDGPTGKKASSLLAVDGTLYMWARNADHDGAQAQLAWSEDLARTWSWSDWLFEEFGYMVFLSFGRDYAGARDDFVYMVSPDGPSAYAPADRFVLIRVPRDRLRNRGAYEFLTRLDDAGEPIWSSSIGDRGPVFEHRGNCLRSGLSFNADLNRYLWWQQLPAGHRGGDTRFEGGFGVYDAPQPWGPWSTAYYTGKWDVGPGETGAFPPKWFADRGRTAHLVFSGDDAFSVRKARFVLFEDDVY